MLSVNRYSRCISNVENLCSHKNLYADVYEVYSQSPKPGSSQDLQRGRNKQNVVHSFNGKLLMKRNELFNHKEKSMNLKFTLVLSERSQSEITYSMVTII